MPSRLQLRLEASIGQATDPIEADVLSAELAALFAREGRLAEAREMLQALKARHEASPDAATAAAIGFADALADYFSDLDAQARGKLQQARALAASAGRRPLQALCAAWLALLDFVHNDEEALARDLALAFTLAEPGHHAARSRACMAAAMAYHHAGRFDLAQPWYTRARHHATQEGDTATLSALMHNMAALRASQAAQAAVLGPAARDGEADTLVALIGAQSSGYFDDGIGRTALPVLHGVLRAQMFALQDRPREALAIYHAHLDAALAQGLGRAECSLRADMAWCHARLGQNGLALAQARLALAALRPECDTDDVALTHGRLAAMHALLDDPVQARRHGQQAQAHWQRHAAAQARVLARLDQALAELPPGLAT